MYSKQEASKLRQEFWTAFGQYMAPVLSAEGEKLNWTNYKTGEKHIAFKMDAVNGQAFTGIELSHKDPQVRQLYFEQFKQLGHLLEAVDDEPWIWKENDTDDLGKGVSRIYQQLEGVNLFRKEDWPALISFFKPRIIQLDEFWSNVRYSFEALR